MAGTFASGEINKMLDAWGGTTTYTANAGSFAQLHIGDPGAAGTSNAAAATTRHSIAWAAASAGTKVSNASVVWASGETATETISWISVWTASSAGTFLGKSQLPSSKSVTAGDTLTIASGNITLSI